MVNAIRGYGGGEKRALRAVTDFRRLGEEVTVFGRPGSAMEARSREYGFPFVPVSMRRYWSPAAVLELARELRKARVDVLLCYDETSVRQGTLAAPLASRRGRRPPVAYFYGLVGSFKNKPFNRRFVAPRVALVGSNAEAGRRELLSFGCFRPDQLRVIPDGVDPGPIETADPTGLREELGARPDDLVVLTAARLVPEKAVPFLIEVLARVLPPRPRVHSWIVGDGPEAENVRAALRRHNLSERVRMPGFRRDLERFYRAADVLCHPSRREGAPNVVREAMVAGLPVVATAASGTPEIVVEGVTGLLSPPDDVAGLERNLSALLDDPALRERFGRAGRERALTEFTEERCAQRWLELLRDCLKR